MANRRAEIAFTDDEVRGFVADGRTLVLTTTGPDGVPDPLPMWYVADESGRIRMRTYAKSQKVRNLERDPTAVVLLEAGDRYAELRGVQLTGHVELERDPDYIAEMVAELAVKYEGLDPAYQEATRDAVREAAKKMVALVFVPEKVVSWDHRKLG